MILRNLIRAGMLGAIRLMLIRGRINLKAIMLFNCDSICSLFYIHYLIFYIILFNQYLSLYLFLYSNY
jgi:hypothetical protein